MGNTLVVVGMVKKPCKLQTIYRPDPAGVHGECVVAAKYRDIKSARNLLQAIHGKKRIEMPSRAGPGNGWLEIIGGKENLEHKRRMPLGVFTCVTGVSGSARVHYKRDIITLAVGSTGQG